MKGVFDLKLDSGYDDDIARRYHFPAKRDYREAALACVGDWIVYRESRRNKGREAYIGTAAVVAVEPDPNDPTHAYARVANFLAFPTLVPLRIAGQFAEAPLRRLLVSHNRVPSELTNLFRPSHEPIHLPKDPQLHPHPRFLAHHRERYANAGH